MKNRVAFFLIFSLFNLTASAQSWLWGVQGNTGLKDALRAKNVATDRTGNVYHVGGYDVSITFGPYTLTSPGIEDAYLVKYDSNGNILWARGSRSSHNNAGIGSIAYSVATDDSDNVYIAGVSGDTIAFGADTLYDFGQMFVVKYDPNGNVVWAKQPSTNIVTYAAFAITTDNFGNEYVSGWEGFLIKFDHNGNIVWYVPQTFNKNGPQPQGYSVATDGYGNIYASGAFDDSLSYGNYKLYTPGYGVYIAKFDSNGNVLWAHQSTDNPGSGPPRYFGEGGYSVAVDRAGAAYITGAFSVDSNDPITFGPYSLTSPTNTASNFFVVKYNPDGNVAWAKDAIPFDGASWGSYSIAADDSNHIYICGANGSDTSQTSSIDSFAFANDTFSVTNTGNDVPAFLLKLDSSGHVICGSTLSAGGTYPDAIASDSTGKFIYMGGAFFASFSLGSDSLIANTGGFDTYVGRWKSCYTCDLVITAAPWSSSICSGQSVELTANGGTNFSWYPSTGLNETTGDTVVATPLVTTTYSVSASIGGCSDSEQVVVTVNPSPIVMVSPGSSLICPYQSALLLASGATTYQWFPSTGLSATTGDSVIANVTASVTYTVIGSTNGCFDTAQCVITIIPAPNQPTITVHGDTLISSALHDNQWFLNDSILIGDTSHILIISGKKGYYFVQVTNPANGCSTNSDSTTAINQLSVTSEQLSIYPNPTSSAIFVKINSAALNVNEWSLQVTDVLGRMLYTKASLNYSNKIDLSNLATEVYFVSVVNKTSWAVFKVVKQN